MTSEEIYSQFLKKHKRILHIGAANSNLASLMEADEYVGVDILAGSTIQLDVNTSIEQIPKGFDYLILAGVLEHLDNPVKLIEDLKYHAKSTIVYQINYDHYDEIKPEWRQVWKNVGCEYTLTKNFDYVNNIFLGYATVNICEMPFTEKEDRVQ